MKVETHQTIARSAGEIWTYAADILRHPDWMAVADAHVLRGDGSQAGARGRERLLLGPFHWDVEFEVVEAEPGRRIVWRTVGDPRFDIEVALDLEPLGPTATRASYGSAVQLRGPWRLLAPLLAMEGSAGVRRELQRLKANVETAPAVSAVM